MKIANSSERWGVVTQLMHWTVVLLVIAQFTIASIAEDLPLGMQKLAWLARHKSVGITILGIAIARLLWRLFSPGPALPSALGPVERLLASVTHIGLYAALFLMPLSGWLMSSAKGYPVSWFNLVQLPDLIAKNEDAFKVLKETHETLAFALIVLALLHVAGALKHQFVYKDNVMKRMLPCLALGFAITVLGYRLPALAAELVSDPSQSKLTFSFTQAGGVNTGSFGKFNVQFSEPNGTVAGGGAGCDYRYALPGYGRFGKRRNPSQCRTVRHKAFSCCPFYCTENRISRGGALPLCRDSHHPRCVAYAGFAAYGAPRKRVWS